MSVKIFKNDYVEVSFSDKKDGDILARFSTDKIISVSHTSMMKYLRNYNLWYEDITQLLLCLRHGVTSTHCISFGDHQIYFDDLTKLALCVDHKYKNCPPGIDSYIVYGDYHIRFEDYLKTTKYWNTPSAIVVIYDLLKLCNEDV